MKKILLIGSMLLCSMMMFNNVNAQNTGKERADRLRKIQNKVDDNTESNIDNLGGCVDSDEWMTGEGYGESAKNPQIAKNHAVAAAQQNLTEKMEAYVENVAEALTYSETNEATEDMYASTLKNRFRQVTKAMRGRIRECYSIPDKDDRGKYTCEYKVVISLAAVNQAMKDAIANDAKLRAQTKMEEFDQKADEIIDRMIANQSSTDE